MTEHEVERWLSTRGCSLWGEFFELTTTAGRQQAAKWMVKQIESFTDWKQS